jgi:conjugal transfer pilus assembly protein TraB
MSEKENVNNKVKKTQGNKAIIVICVFGVLSICVAYAIHLTKVNNQISTQSVSSTPDMTGVINQSFTSNLDQATADTSAQQISDFQKSLTELKNQIKSLQSANASQTAQIAELKATQTTQESQPVVTNNQMQGQGGNSADYASTVNQQPIVPDNHLSTVTFNYPAPPKVNRYPYIPSGSFAQAVVIEGADTNASVTGQSNTAPMELRLTGDVTMPNNKTFNLTGCFITADAYGDVSSARAEVRTRGISCDFGKNDIIDQPIKGHVAFMGKNGIKGTVVMNNGKIVGWAFGSGFLDGIGSGISTAANPIVGIGGTATMGTSDILKSAAGGGASGAAKTLSQYFIKRAEQYHPIIPIGAGNKVTVVFQDGFQLIPKDLSTKTQNNQQTASDKLAYQIGSATQQTINATKAGANSATQQATQQADQIIKNSPNGLSPDMMPAINQAKAQAMSNYQNNFVSGVQQND